MELWAQGISDVEREWSRRGPALRVVLRTLASFGVGACAGPSGRSGSACDPAVACGLLDADDECDPTAALAGSDAVEILRRGVKILGGS